MSKKTLILTGFILLKFVLQYFFIGPAYDLQRDEYLHLDQARHLAWGYESVPPFTSWISWIIMQLGNSVFWVKFFPALFGAITILLVWKTIELLNGSLFALVMGAIAATCSVLLRINILYQPNSFDILCWTAFYFGIISFMKTNNNRWLYFTAMIFAAGFLNKYNIGFLLIGVLPGLLLTPQRRLLLNKHVYFAAAVSVVLILPNLLWQYHNHFPFFHHMEQLEKTQLINVTRSDFFKEQVFFFLNSFFVILLALLSFFIFPVFVKYRFVFWSFVITLFAFSWFRAKGYYAIGLYPILLSFGAVYLEKITHYSVRWLRVPALIIPCLIFSLFIKDIFPVLSPEKFIQHADGHKFRWEDGKQYPLPQDFADMLGWSELAKKTDSIYSLMNNKENVLVLCDNYGEAGAINFYSKQSIKAVSLNADYINWINLDNPIDVVISVNEKNSTALVIERTLFNDIRPVASIDNRYAREEGTTIFILSSPKTDINKILKTEIKKRK